MRINKQTTKRVRTRSWLLLVVSKTILAKRETEWVNHTVTINHLWVDKIHFFTGYHTEDSIKEYVIKQIRMDKRLYSKYKFM